MLMVVFYYAAGSLFMLWILATTCLNGNVLPPLSILFVKPFSPALHEKILQWLADLGWGSIIDYAEIVGRMQPVITGDIVDKENLPTGNKILLCNHVSMSDNIAVFVAARTLGHLGHLRFFAKRELMYFPILGWAAYFLSFIFLKRSWHEDKESVFKTFERMVGSRYKRQFCLVMYPEGTRATESKLAESREFSQARGMPVFKNVLVPRTKGLVAALGSLRSEVDAVVDVTVGYTERWAHNGAVRPSVADMLLRRDKVWPLHMHVRVIPISEIPPTPEGQREWVLGLFQAKDELLEGFKREGRFPGQVKVLAPPRVWHALGRMFGYMATAVSMLGICVICSRGAAAAVCSLLSQRA